MNALLVLIILTCERKTTEKGTFFKVECVLKGKQKVAGKEIETQEVLVCNSSVELPLGEQLVEVKIWIIDGKTIVKIADVSRDFGRISNSAGKSAPTSK